MSHNGCFFEVLAEWLAFIGQATLGRGSWSQKHTVGSANTRLDNVAWAAAGGWTQGDWSSETGQTDSVGVCWPSLHRDHRQGIREWTAGVFSLHYLEGSLKAKAPESMWLDCTQGPNASYKQDVGIQATLALFIIGLYLFNLWSYFTLYNHSLCCPMPFVVHKNKIADKNWLLPK